MSEDQIKVELLNYMGDDLSVVNAARVSFNKQSYWDVSNESYELPDKDTKLIDYLAKHKHYSPFGHCFASFRITAPIFVCRQLVKHEYLRMNEVSRRYVDEPPQFYIPETWRLKPEGSIKQGSGSVTKAPNRYGEGLCWYCGNAVAKPKAGPVGKWCCEKCRNYYRKEQWPDDRLTHVKANAAKRGVEYNLHRGDVEWPTHCPVFKTELSYRSGDDVRNSPSLDRIDTTKPYEKDNVMVMSQKANVMKNDASPEELVSFAKWVLLRYKGVVVPEESTYEGLMTYMVGYYKKLIEEGYAPEQARMVLPLSTMTSWWWSGSLDAFANMCKLRLKEDTQYETRLVAQQISDYMTNLYPISWGALLNETD